LVTGDILNDVALTIGNQHPAAGFFFTGQMDDVRIFDFELTSDQVDNLATTTTKLQSQLEITGLDLTTPSSSLTSGATEAIVTLKFDVTHSDGAIITGDENAQTRVDSINFGTNQDDSTISTISDPFSLVSSIVAVRVLVTYC